MKKEITHFDVGSVALMAGAVMAIISLLFCIFFFSVLSLPFSMMRLGGYERSLMFGGGMFFIIFIPVIYGVVGLTLGALSAIIYNFIAGRIGGVKIYIRE